jgi:PBP1b-binding outer membrane lipoprotein LpoB
MKKIIMIVSGIILLAVFFVGCGESAKHENDIV